MTARETYTQCVVLSNKVCLVCWCHKVDELNSKQNKTMWSSVWSRLSLSFPGNFLVVCPLQHDSILKKNFTQKSFSKNGMTLRSPQKNLRKESWRRTRGTTKWHKLAQVGVRGTSGTRRSRSSDLRGTSGTRRRGSSDRRGTSRTRTRGLSSWTSPLVPKWVYKAAEILPRPPRQVSCLGGIDPLTNKSI